MSGSHGWTDVFRALNVSLSGAVLGLILTAVFAYVCAERMRRLLPDPPPWAEPRAGLRHPVTTGLGVGLLVVYTMVGQLERVGMPFSFRAPLAATGQLLVGWSMVYVLRFQRRMITALRERIRSERCGTPYDRQS